MRFIHAPPKRGRHPSCWGCDGGFASTTGAGKAVAGPMQADEMPTRKQSSQSAATGTSSPGRQMRISNRTSVSWRIDCSENKKLDVQALPDIGRRAAPSKINSVPAGAVTPRPARFPWRRWKTIRVLSARRSVRPSWRVSTCTLRLPDSPHGPKVASRAFARHLYCIATQNATLSGRPVASASRGGMIR